MPVRQSAQLDAGNALQFGLPFGVAEDDVQVDSGQVVGDDSRSGVLEGHLDASQGFVVQRFVFNGGEEEGREVFQVEFRRGGQVGLGGLHEPFLGFDVVEVEVLEGGGRFGGDDVAGVLDDDAGWLVVLDGVSRGGALGRIAGAVAGV